MASDISKPAKSRSALERDISRRLRTRLRKREEARDRTSDLCCTGARGSAVQITGAVPPAILGRASYGVLYRKSIVNQRLRNTCLQADAEPADSSRRVFVNDLLWNI